MSPVDYEILGYLDADEARLGIVPSASLVEHMKFFMGVTWSSAFMRTFNRLRRMERDGIVARIEGARPVRFFLTPKGASLFRAEQEKSWAEMTARLDKRGPRDAQ